MLKVRLLKTGDGDPAVRVCDLGCRPGAFS